MDSVPAGDLMRHNITDQFPCLFPVNPQMYKKLDRLQSFKVPTIWPHHILATPNELADAGFFYLGESDRVKCFYCNGGFGSRMKDRGRNTQSGFLYVNTFYRGKAWTTSLKQSKIFPT